MLKIQSRQQSRLVTICSVTVQSYDWRFTTRLQVPPLQGPHSYAIVIWHSATGVHFQWTQHPTGTRSPFAISTASFRQTKYMGKPAGSCKSQSDDSPLRWDDFADDLPNDTATTVTFMTLLRAEAASPKCNQYQ